VDPRLDAWLSTLHDHDGTDILLTDGSKPLLRVGGRLMPLEEAEVLTGEEIEVIARTQLHDQYGDRLHLGKEVDFSFSWRDKARIRASAFYQRSHCSLSMRRIPMRIPSFDELGLPEALTGILSSPSGLILVTGPPGSGKTTSMAAMIDVVNRLRACHIVTIEDPIEYLHHNQKAAVSQREVGTDTESFEQALKSVLREDPDVVLVGALRDAESVAALLTIAEAGRLVIAALHADDSTQAVDRIVEVFPAERRNQARMKLAATLLAVMHQRLVPRVDGGLVAACELIVGVPALRGMVREGRTGQLRDVVADHRDYGMQTLEDSLGALFRAGIIDYETAVSASLHPREIRRDTPVAATSRV